MSIQAVAWAFEQDVADPAAKLVLMSLANAYNQQKQRCFPTVRQIMKEAGISEMGARRKLKVLVDLGLVAVKPCFAADGRQQSNEYLLAGFGEGIKMVGGGYQADRGEGTNADRGEGTSCDTPLKEPEETPEETSLGASAPSQPASPSKAKKGEKQDDNGFEAFWDAYPKRDGPNPKKPARLAYERSIKRGSTPQGLLAGAADLAHRHPKPTRFCPQAVTWLNQDRVVDEGAADSKPKGYQTLSEAEWAKALQTARDTNKWWIDDLGPMPGDTGCRVPEHLITDSDRRQNFVTRRSA